MRYLVAVIGALLVVGGCSDAPTRQRDEIGLPVAAVSVVEHDSPEVDEVDPLFDNDSAGARLSFDGCRLSRDGVWRFSGRLVLPRDTPEASFIVTVGWPLYTDEGAGADVVRRVDVVSPGASFSIEFSADDTEQTRNATTVPTGSVYDDLCLLGVSRGTVGVVQRAHRGAPTSDQVVGPRSVVNGRLLGGPAEWKPRDPDVTGWMTGIALGAGSNWEPVGGIPMPATWGPATIEIDGAAYDVPAGTPAGLGTCGMLLHFGEYGGDGGPGAGGSACFVTAGMGSDGVIEWISLVPGPFISWDELTGWEEARDPADSVDFEGVAVVGDDHVVVQGLIPLRLELDAHVDFDCSPVLRADLDVIPGALNAIATFDLERGVATRIRCESLFFG